MLKTNEESVITEETTDDANAENSTEQNKSEEENKSEDDNKENNVDDETLSDKPFAGLDLRAAHCFGYRVPKENSWFELAKQVDDMGLRHVNISKIEHSLTKDVDDSYLKIAEFKLVNVDDDMAYYLWFDNNKAMWNVSILDSPNAEMTIEERADFFKSDMFKKIANKSYYKIVNAFNLYNQTIKPLIDNGKLLLVDAVKLDAILHFLNLDYFMKNLLNGKYLNN